MRKLSIFVALIAAVTALAACGGPKPPAPSPDTAPVAAAGDSNAAAEAQAKEKQALEAGVEAVVYGLPLVIMDITRAKTSNVARPEDLRPSQPVLQQARVPRRLVQGRRARERRYALLVGLARPVEGADRALGAGHQGPLLPDADDGRVDQHFRLPGQAHDRHEAGALRDHRTGLDRNAAGGVRSSSRRPTWSGSSGARRPTDRPTTRPCMRSRTASSSCPVLFRQAIHSAGRYGRPERRHEDGARDQVKTMSSEAVFQPDGRADEVEPAAGVRRTRPGEAEGDRHRPGREVRSVQARPGRGQGTRAVGAASR